MSVEPIPDQPAAIADCGDERVLVVADYHAGLERSLRREGVELRSRATERREAVLTLCGRTDPDRLLFLGDLATAIGAPDGEEAAELRELLTAAGRAVAVTVVKGNHDGELESLTEQLPVSVDVTGGGGIRIGRVGFVHGHTWPDREVLAAQTVCTAHEHPVVRLEDEVGGARKERVWLRGRLDPSGFGDRYEPPLEPTDMVVFPAFNDLSGGTWVNVEGQSFLSPFLPDGLVDGQAYLLDGTRLGPYERV